jgi:pimeloyl-ACP methyl ester carboxylesterase
MKRRALLTGAAVLAAPAAVAQKYPAGTKQRLLRFPSVGGIQLNGTLLLPIISELQRVPGVVLIGGSGPTDRDGNNSLLPLRIDLLKQIAELLAKNGIGSLRYDKRGVAASAAQAPVRFEEQERFYAWDNYVGDVMAAHAELLRHDEIKPYATALLGHSEGGLLALAAAGGLSAKEMGVRKLHGLVLAATPGRPLADIVRAQIARNAPSLVEPAERTMNTIIATGRVNGAISARPRISVASGAILSRM